MKRGRKEAYLALDVPFELEFEFEAHVLCTAAPSEFRVAEKIRDDEHFMTTDNQYVLD